MVKSRQEALKAIQEADETQGVKVMFLKTVTRNQAMTAGLSVAFLALMTGMSLAQDVQLTDPPEEAILVEDPGIDAGGAACDPCAVPGDEEVIYTIDPIEIVDGDPINIDGIGDGEPLVVFTDGIGDGEIVPINTDGIGDGEPLPDVVLDDDMGGVVGEEPLPEVVTTDFPDSNCGGCEYQDFAPGGPEVQRTVTGATHSSGSHDGGSFAGAEVVSDENNICYNADLYIPLLCDWQRPFVGDRMP
jgi:hypothetical protein